MKDILSEAPFYPGWFSEFEKSEIRRNKLWPVALALHHINKKLFVTAIQQGPSIVMSLENGSNIYHIKVNSEGAIDVIDITTQGRAETVMSSKHSDYLVKNISNPDTTSRKQIIARIDGADSFMQLAIFSTVAETYVNYSGQQPVFYNAKLDGAMAEWAVLLAAGKLNSMSDGFSSYAQAASRIATQVIQSKQSIIDYTKKANEFFVHDKWLIGKGRGTDKLVVGSLNTGFVVPMVMQYVQHRYGVELKNPPEYANTLRMYKSFADVDPDIRDQLQGALAFTKVYREGQSKLALECVDSENYIPTARLLYPDVGSVSFNNSSIHGMYFLLANKLG
jgi:hypothetical protein